MSAGKPDRIAQALEYFFGVRCEDFDESCPCCQAWEQYDQILAAKAEEREAVEPLTVAVAAVVAEAETISMTIRRRRIFDLMKGRLYAYRNRLALGDVNTAHKNSEG